MRHLRALMESRPTPGRVPDQSFVADTLAGAEHIRATRGQGYLFVYSPQGAAFALRSEPRPSLVREAWWFDPRDGRAQRIGRLAENQTIHSFTPPTRGRGQDWVLVVDEERRRFSAPGETPGPTTQVDSTQNWRLTAQP